MIELSVQPFGATNFFQFPFSFFPSVKKKMKQTPDTRAKRNASKRDWNIDRPITRAYIKQEAKSSEELLNNALYPLVKTESPSLEIGKYNSK